MKQQSWNKAKRWFAWLGGGAIVLCLAAGGFWYWINIPPQVNIPTPVMPKPNGYDYFQRAAAAYVNDNKGVDEITSTSSKPKKYPLVAKEAWLRKNAKALHLLRQGLKHPALQPTMRSYDFTSFYFAQCRGLGRALVVESHARGERGDWNGAARSLLDDYHFGNQIARDGSLVAGLVGIAIRAISLRELGNLVSHNNATTAKMVATSIEKMYEQRYPYYKTLQAEKWWEQSIVLQTMSFPSWRVNLSRHVSAPAIFDDPDSSSWWLKSAKILVISKRKLIDDSAEMLDGFIANARRPYSKRQPVSALDPYAAMTHPVLKRSQWNWARGDTHAVEIMAMYALRAYKMDNGHYPTNLKSLVPTYLHKVPIDPFDGIAPLHYKLQGEEYLLWSIGPDCVDNHGTPIINKNANGSSLSMINRERYRFVSPDSNGDVVAGINMP